MDSNNTPLNILVVEDNENLRESICDALTGLGHHVRDIDCAEALAEQAELALLDLAILDLNLPGEDGLSLAQRLRVTHPQLGIIMLTARTQSEDRAAGYALGADIYLTKPATLLEIKHAINALARRIKPQESTNARPVIELDTLRLQIKLPNGASIALNTAESALLCAFVRAAQNTLENWQIAEIIGMDVAHLNKPALELHIVRLRKKLSTQTDLASPIQVIRGHGYKLCTPLRLAN